MKIHSTPFWKTKSLEDMSLEEWELICDGCGNCCLEKFEDENDGRIRVVPVACEFLDTTTCRCIVYPDRMQVCGDCVDLTPESLKGIDWLPETCAYRLLTEGKELPEWHPLLSERPGTVHEAGISVRNRVVQGKHVHPDDLLSLAEYVKIRYKD